MWTGLKSRGSCSVVGGRAWRNVAVRLSRGLVGARVLCVLALVVGVSACRADNGGRGEASGGPASLLPDARICDVFSNSDLVNVLGFRTYYHRYSDFYNGVEQYYNCYADSDKEPFGLIEVSYSRSDNVAAAGLDGYYRFDDVPLVFADSVEAFSFDAVEGDGWAFIDGVSMYVIWLYPDGFRAVVCMTSWTEGGPTKEQVEQFHAVVVEPVLAQLPERAAQERQQWEQEHASAVPTEGETP